MSDRKLLSKDRKKWIIENFLSLGFALLIVFMIRSSIVEAFKIPSGSMIPTLYIGDYIFVNKFAYGLKIPFSDILTDHPIYIINRAIPKRGDVIVFKYPKDESKYYIKRVIGVPGDTIEMTNKVLYVNQKRVTQDPIPDLKTETVLKDLNDPQYPIVNMKLDTEHLDTIDHTIMIDSTSHRSENFGPVTVPEESLFTMGDNRDGSGDSRFWGFVPMENVRGKAIVVWLSLWIDFSENKFSFRPNRIGTMIH